MHRQRCDHDTTIAYSLWLTVNEATKYPLSFLLTIVYHSCTQRCPNHPKPIVGGGPESPRKATKITGQSAVWNIPSQAEIPRHPRAISKNSPIPMSNSEVFALMLKRCNTVISTAIPLVSLLIQIDTINWYTVLPLDPTADKIPMIAGAVA